MKRFLSATLLSAALLCSAAIAQTPKTSAELLDAARKQAAAEKKHVFVRFTASWCGWCKRMDGVLTSKAIKPIWDKYFVTVPIVVLETPANRKLETFGGEALLEKQGGKDQGIPFFYFMDASGKTLANSMRPANGTDKGGNLGCPYEPAEVEFFMSLLKTAAPAMTDAERTAIRDAFAALKKADQKPW
jgi:thiol-disulfide isomerase/thioredoxin